MGSERVPPLKRRPWARRWAVWATVGAMAVVAAATLLWRETNPRAASAGAVEPVSIAINERYPGSCPILVAKARGYFASEGLQVTVKPYSSGKKALAAALQGEADIATSADLPIVLAVLEGQPLSVFATIFRAENDHAVVARRDRGVVSVASLRGRSIGVTKGTSAHFFLDNLLIRHDMVASEVTLVDVAADRIVDALTGGEVDAIASWQPLIAQAQIGLGSNENTLLDPTVATLTWNLVGRTDTLAGRSPMLQAVLRAVARGAALCRDHPGEAITIVAAATNVQASQLQKLWRDYRFGLSLDQGLLLVRADRTLTHPAD